MISRLTASAAIFAAFATVAFAVAADARQAPAAARAIAPEPMQVIVLPASKSPASARPSVDAAADGVFAVGQSVHFQHPLQR